MESLELLLAGLQSALAPTNLVFALLGCLIGTLTGVLPGVGPAAGTAILLPLTFALDPTQAIIMLAAIYYGAMYGGTITSVLLNVPGEAASAITCLDGHAMARKGRAGPALSVAAIGSFIGGTAATFLLVFVAPPLSSLALRFGPPEFFALMVLGLAMVTGLAGRSMVRALISATLGLLIAMVGIDPVAGQPRFTFGQFELLDGIAFVPLAMGLFGIGEILANVGARRAELVGVGTGRLGLGAADARASAGPIARGTLIGSALGFIPGIGSIVPSFLSYATERRISRTPERFGNGAIEGVAGPETANNAYANSALIPLFTLGIPSSPTVAILMGAFMMNGLTPGPQLFEQQSTLVWTVIASLLVGNLILVLLNLPAIPMWLQILRIPRPVLFSVILVFCIVGAYSLNSRVFDIAVMLVFGLVGFVFRKVDIPLAPLVLTVILGPLMERTLRQSLEMSGGAYSILWASPLSIGLLMTAAAALVVFTVRTRSGAARATNVDAEA